MKRYIKKIMSVVIGLSILSSSSILAKKEIKHENIAYNKSKHNHNNLKLCVKVGSAVVLPTLILAYLNKNKLFNMFSKKNFKISEVYKEEHSDSELVEDDLQNLELREIELLQKISTLNLNYNLWVNLLSELNLDSCYHDECFYNIIDYLSEISHDIPELREVFPKIKKKYKNLVKKFLENARVQECLCKYNRNIKSEKIEIKTGSESDKINRENQLRGQSNTYSTPGNFINLYNRADSNSSSPKLILCHDLNKEKIKFFELPPIKTVFESFGLTNVPEKPDLNWYKYGSEQVKGSNLYLRTINEKTKELLKKWFSNSKCAWGKFTHEFIFGDDWRSHFERLILSEKGEYPQCLEFYSKLLYWIDRELTANGFKNGNQLLKDLGLNNSDLVVSRPNIPETYGKNKRKCAKLWFMFAQVFCQYEEMCYNQLPNNMPALQSIIDNYFSSSQKDDYSDLKTKTFSDILFPKIHEKLRYDCFNKFYKVLGYSDSNDAENLNGFTTLTANLLNIPTNVEMCHEFRVSKSNAEIAEILREFLTPKYILDTIIDNSEKFDYNFRSAIVNWWLNDYTFNRFDYDLLNQLYDNKLDSEINSLINMLLTYNEEDIVKAREILQNLKAHKTVSLGDLNEVAEIIACDYSELLGNLHIVNCLFKDIRKYGTPDLDTMKRQFAFAYMFKLKEEKYIDFTSQA